MKSRLAGVNADRNNEAAKARPKKRNNRWKGKKGDKNAVAEQDKEKEKDATPSKDDIDAKAEMADPPNAPPKPNVEKIEALQLGKQMLRESIRLMKVKIRKSPKTR